MKKSSDPPVQNMNFLGLLNDSVSMKYFVSNEKSVAIRNDIVAILKEEKTHVKTLAKLVGKLASCVKAFGPTIRLLTRSCYQDIAKAETWI